MIITVTNQKGGVGKSTTAVNLSTGLARFGHSVLLVDTDSQANATQAFFGRGEYEVDISHVLTNKSPIEEAILQSRYVDVVPSGPLMTDVPDVLKSAVAGQMRLRGALASIRDKYDYIIIDTPPSLGMLTINALAACDQVVIPVNPGIFAMNGTETLLRSIDEANSGFNLAVSVLGFLITFKDNTKVSRQVESVLRSNFGDKVFKTMIPRNIRLEEAHCNQQDIYEYDKYSTGATSYALFSKEVRERVQ